MMTKNVLVNQLPKNLVSINAMDRKVNILAQNLYTMSLDDLGVSSEKVSAVLQNLRENPPRKYKDVLKVYLAKIKRQLRKENALIEYSGELDAATLDSIKQGLNDHYNTELKVAVLHNPKLIAGIRISVGDDVWDSSVLGRLKSLSNQFTS